MQRINSQAKRILRRGKERKEKAFQAEGTTSFWRKKMQAGNFN
jgi:hypothetical protein